MHAGVVLFKCLDKGLMLQPSDPSYRRDGGVGKDLVAELIHKLSKRSHKPFLPLNCANFPDQLVKSELFLSESFQRYFLNLQNTEACGSRRPRCPWLLILKRQLSELAPYLRR